MEHEEGFRIDYPLWSISVGGDGIATVKRGSEINCIIFTDDDLADRAIEHFQNSSPEKLFEKMLIPNKPALLSILKSAQSNGANNVQFDYTPAARFQPFVADIRDTVNALESGEGWEEDVD